MRRGQAAQVVVWVAVMLPLLFLPIVGLAMDAGAVFDARRSLQNVADGAARVGAMQLDVAEIRRSGVVQLDKASANQVAMDYVAQMLPGARPPVIIPLADTITVSLEGTVRPKFLSLLHVQPVTVRATAQAHPCTVTTCP